MKSECWNRDALRRRDLSPAAVPTPRIDHKDQDLLLQHLVLLQHLLEHLQVTVDERNRGARQHPRHPDGLDARKRKLATVGINQIVGRLVPVVPAVVPAEEDLVAILGSLNIIAAELDR